MYRTILLAIIKIGLLAVPFIPLFVAKTLFFPFITGKAFLFRFIVELVFAAWGALALLHKEYRPKKSALVWAILVFFAIVALATAFSANPYRSFWSNYERMEGFISYAHLLAYFIVLGHAFRKRDWLIFFNAFLVAGFIENIYALFQRFGKLASFQGGFRVEGTIGNPAYLAAYLIFVFGFCLLLISFSKQAWQRWMYASLAALNLLIIYFTASRGPVLALLAGALLAGVLYIVFKKDDPLSRRYKMAAGGSLAFLAAIVAVLWAYRGSNFVQSSSVLARLTSVSLQERTTTSRFSIWQMGLEAAKEHPLLGWGPENFSIVFSKYYRPELWRQEPWFDRAHNIIIDWLINAGVLGVLAYMGILVAAAHLVWQQYRHRRLSFETSLLVSALLAAYFLQNLFVFDNITTYIGFFSILAFLHHTATADSPGEEKRHPAIADSRKIAAISGSAMLFAACFYSFTYRPLSANISLLEAIQLQSTDVQGMKPADLELLLRRIFAAYQKALSVNSFGNGEVTEQFIRFSLAAGGVQGIDAGFKDQALRAAMQAAQNLAAQNSQDARAQLFLANFYSNVGLRKEALDTLEKALSLSPKKQQIYFEIADIHFQAGEYDKAIEISKKAYELEKGFPTAIFNLVAIYVHAGRQAEADRMLIEAYGRTDVPDVLLAQIYSKEKDYARLAGVWRAFVEKEPGSLVHRKNLVNAFLSGRRYPEAIAELEKAVKDFPEFSSEGSALVARIKKDTGLK